MAPLRLLKKDNVEFVFWPAQKESFEQLKSELLNLPELAHFSSTAPVEIAVDDSMEGLGAMLFQAGRLVAAASRMLTPAERNYPNIDREAAAIPYGVPAPGPRWAIQGAPEVRQAGDHAAGAYGRRCGGGAESAPCAGRNAQDRQNEARGNRRFRRAQAFRGRRMATLVKVRLRRIVARIMASSIVA